MAKTDTWILCPNLWGARLFRFTPAVDWVPARHSGISFVKELKRPRVRTQLEDFRDEEESREFKSVEDPELERHVAEEFMFYVAKELETAAEQDEFGSLILCAEMHLLTLLQKTLGRLSRSRLAGVVALDLYEVNESDLAVYVQDYIKPSSPERAA